MSDSWFKYDRRIRWQHLKGKPRVMKIIGFGEIKKDGFGEERLLPVLYFEKTDKYLELNDTNRMILVEMFGDDKSLSKGRFITLAPEKVRNGKMGIVILAAAQTSPATVAAREPSDTTAAPRALLDQVWDLAALHEEPKETIEAILTEHGGDAQAALAALQAKYSSPSSL